MDKERWEPTAPDQDTGTANGEVLPWIEGAGGTEGLAAEEVAAADSFGAWLRRQREMREIELREIADRTKISIRYLKAMEQNRFDVLPGPIFAKGFLREYAKYVGLNPDEVVNYYLSTQQEAGEEPEEAAAKRSRASWGKGLALALLAVLALALLSFFLFSYLERRPARRQAPEPPPITAPVVPVPEPVEPAATAGADQPRAPLEVTIDFVQDCWLEALVDGQRQVAQLFAQGESLQLAAQEQVVLASIGNAGGLELQVNGRPYDLGGREGQTLTNVVIDLALADSLIQRRP